MDQIYAAAQSGHLDQAQQMISQVPGCAGHPTRCPRVRTTVQAELYAREGKTAFARSELGTAEQLKPGLPFENQRSVQELKAQLGLSPGVMSRGVMNPTVIRSVPAPRPFPWVTVLILAGVVAILLMVFSPSSSSTCRGNIRPAPPWAARRKNLPDPAGYGPGPMGGGGIGGSGIAGGLASGLAVGAGGWFAGEERCAHHFLWMADMAAATSPPPAEAGDAGLQQQRYGRLRTSA